MSRRSFGVTVSMHYERERSSLVLVGMCVVVMVGVMGTRRDMRDYGPAEQRRRRERRQGKRGRQAP